MPKKILLIDDEESILEMLQFALEGEGYEVEATTSGNEITKLDSNFPDLILLDVLLSGEDGREIAKQLKSQTQTKDIPIIMMSAHPSAVNSIEECGANYFLSKPFDIDEMLDVVKKYSSSKH